MQNRKCSHCGKIFPEYKLKRVDPKKYGFVFVCRECYDEINGITYRDFTDSENREIDAAVELTIQKYLEQGGREEDMESLDYIDYFFCMMLYNKGKRAVRDFARRYTYDPNQRRQPVYYKEEVA